MTAGECGSRTGWCWPLVSLSTFQQVSLSGKDGRAGYPSSSPRRVLKYMSREIVRNIYSGRARSLHRIPLLPLVNLNSQKIKLILHLHKILLSIGKIGSNRSLKGHAFMSLGTSMVFFLYLFRGPRVMQRGQTLQPWRSWNIILCIVHTTKGTVARIMQSQYILLA